MLRDEALLSLSRGIYGNSRTASELRNELLRVVRMKVYRKWFEDGQYLEERCAIPLENHPVMTAYGLLEPCKTIGGAGIGYLQVRINSLRGRILITDGFWVKRADQVFSDTDESEDLLEYLDRYPCGFSVDTMVDIATGCGNHLMGLDGPTAGVGLDVNFRALIFACINREINSARNLLFAHNDIRRGLPRFLYELGGNILMVANISFGLSSPLGILPNNVDGGESGADLQIATLHAFVEFVNDARNVHNWRFVLSSYTLGMHEMERWLVPETARTLFGSANIRWSLLKDKRIWRINGRKRESNPMNLASGLRKRADCRFYTTSEEREGVRIGDVALAERLNKEGWDSLGYGVIDISLT